MSGEGGSCVPRVESFRRLAEVVYYLISNYLMDYSSELYELSGDRVVYCDPRGVNGCVKSLITSCFREASSKLIEGCGEGVVGEAIKSMLEELSKAEFKDSLKVSRILKAEVGVDSGVTDLKAEALRAVKSLMRGYSRLLCSDGLINARLSVKEEYVIGSEGPLREGALGIELVFNASALVKSLLSPSRIVNALGMEPQGLPGIDGIVEGINSVCGDVCRSFEIIHAAGGRVYLYDPSTLTVNALVEGELSRVAGPDEIAAYASGSLEGLSDEVVDALNALKEFLKGKGYWEETVSRTAGRR